MADTSDTAKADPEHPAWKRFWQSRKLWESLIDAAAKAHRLMEDATDELEAAGEVHRDPR